MQITVHIRYYAMLREACGRDTETRTTTAKTARDLYVELAASYGFRIPPDRLKLAVNNEFQAWDTELNNGDELAFLPPVAGG